MKLVSSKYLQVVSENGDIYIYNSLFGNLFKTTKETLDLINLFKDGNTTEYVENEFGMETVKKVEELQRRLFLIKDGLDERELLRNKISDIEGKVKTGGLIYKLQIVTTTGCNLACVYCYRSKVIDPLLAKKQRKMNFQTAKKAVDGFLNITQRNGKEEVYVRFFGGEPLLNWDLIENVVKYIDSLGIVGPKINYLLNTNGICVNDSIAKFLSEHNFTISLSLDGRGVMQDRLRKSLSGSETFNKVDKAIDILRHYENKIEISTTLVDDNLYHLRELIDYLYEKELDELDINPLCYPFQINPQKASVEEKVKQLIDARKYGREKGIKVSGKWLRLYKRTNEITYLSYCKRMGEQLSVEPSRDIYPCSGWSLKIGDVENIENIPNSEEYRKVALRVAGNLPSCYGCEIESMCAGGCAGNVYILTGDSYGPELSECEFRREITKKLIPIEIWEEVKDECNQI